MSNILEVNDAKKYFSMGNGLTKMFSQDLRMLKAVDGITFTVRSGETFGIAGESGCGKSTLARMICKLTHPTEGNLSFRGIPYDDFVKEQKKVFHRGVQMVFQDPLSSLNPRKTIEQILGTALTIQEGLMGNELKERVISLLEDVDLRPAAEYYCRYPHELSGGEKQRVVIARAVSLHPSLIVADEPVASLDMSVRGKILNLMKRLQVKYDISFVFISHDLRVLGIMTDRLAVMYLGRFVELSETAKLLARPKHPYTKGLIDSELIPDPASVKTTRGTIIKGEVPSAITLPSGCRFHTRCPYAQALCGQTEPVLSEVAPGEFVACHYWREFYETTAAPSR